MKNDAQFGVMLRQLAIRTLASRTHHICGGRRLSQRFTSALLQQETKPSLNTIATRGLATSKTLQHVAIQQPAPDFQGKAVINGEFREVSLKDYKGKYLVLLFYPLDFTFVCPTEIIAFSQKANEFRDVNTQVIGISVDSEYSHLAWTNTSRKVGRISPFYVSACSLQQGGIGPINFPLLSDLQKKISRDYEVLLEDAGVALRGLFLIDPDGIIRHMSVNDLPVGRSVEEVLRLVKAFQFVETHGEVCPAGWQPDSETIKPNPEGSKEYFEKVNK
ncbi:Thioredoxin-dependent peroxide reductase, mitochondrial [Holothuria leucospilota]|uniref:thioredoxin-dependent peroxiredoxin n=1 Tax=Holothuria leucospilota TaxID=206669 RepID=A0A9Q1C768_HOLLE|nr:Thioredoxin-dependent peroxide reductase, mitochondrial [Holothuria leucospilota]